MEDNFKNKRKFILFPLFAIAFVLVGGYVVMQLWNYILPSTIVGVGELSYLKAIGLLILSKILFGGFKGKSHGKCSGEHDHHTFWKEKIMHMTEEDKEKFKAEWKNRCSR